MPPKAWLFTEQMEDCIAAGVLSICHFSMPVTADSRKHAELDWSRCPTAVGCEKQLWLLRNEILITKQAVQARHAMLDPIYQATSAPLGLTINTLRAKSIAKQQPKLYN